MNNIAMEVANLTEMLPDSEQNLVYEMVKRIVLAWDPDFTKLTPTERMELENAKDEEYVSDVEWK